jgi:hypothetical protein
MAKTASETLGVPLENVLIQGRPQEPRVVPVRENGLEYEVRLSGGQVGLDPALRVLRHRLKEEAQGKRALLLGPGASTFGAAAKSGGALSTTEGEALSPRDRGTYHLAAIEVPSLEDHIALLNIVARRMEPSGVVYLVIRERRPKLDTARLADWNVEDVSATTLPEEFRSRKIHRIWRLVFR